MTTYTKGPYVAWDDGRSIGIVGQDGEPLQIAEVVDHGDMVDEDQMLADQRLFAASFDMAQALKMARDAMTPPNNEEEAAACAEIDRVLAAINGNGDGEIWTCPRCGNSDQDGSDRCPDCGESM